jgi:hypothetical protein
MSSYLDAEILVFYDYKENVFLLKDTSINKIFQKQTFIARKVVRIPFFKILNALKLIPFVSISP